MKEQSGGLSAGSGYYWHIIIVATLCFVAYSNSFYGDFIWDDRDQVLRNDLIRSFHNIPTAFTSHFWAFADSKEANSNYYRPFQTLTYMLAYRLGGTSPAPYHLINVTLHALASILVYLICRELQFPLFVQLFAAALFAVHPVHTEAVTWIAGVTDTGCGAFYFLSIWGFLKYIRTSVRKWIYLSAASFLCALFFKEMAITLPAVLGLIALRRQGLRRTIPKIREQFGPYLAVLAIYVWIRWTALGQLLVNQPVKSADLMDWITLGLTTFGQYIKYALVPYPLAGYHLTVLQLEHRPWSTLLYLALTLAAGCGVWLARKRFPELPAWFLCFGLTLVPVFNFATISQVTVFAERYLYIPTLAVVIAVAMLVGRLPRLSRLAVSCALILLGGGLTFARNRDWANNEVFYASELKQYPECLLLRLNLAELLLVRGDVDAAKQHFETALEHSRSTVYIQAPNQKPRAQVGLANVALRSKKYEEVKKYAQEAVQQYSGDERPHMLLGIAARDGDGDIHAALMHYEKAVQTAPRNEVAHDDLGSLLVQVNRHADALKHFREALKINPASKQAQDHLYRVLVDLGGAAAQQQQYDQAKAYLDEALKIHPNDPAVHIYRGGVAMEADRDYQTALSHLQKAIDLNPGNEVAHDYMGTILFNLGRFAEAAKYFQNAVQINPSYKEGQMHLEMARQKLPGRNP